MPRLCGDDVVSAEKIEGPRLLNPRSTAAIVFGAHDWTEIGVGRAPSFRRSARGIVAYLYDPAGLGLDPELVLDLFDDPSSALEQVARMGGTLDELLSGRRSILLRWAWGDGRRGSYFAAGTPQPLRPRGRNGHQGVGSRSHDSPCRATAATHHHSRLLFFGGGSSGLRRQCSEPSHGRDCGEGPARRRDGSADSSPVL